jgi:hypothetical protein
MTPYARILIALVTVCGTWLSVAPAEAGPRLRLGVPRITNDGVAAVPVFLVAKRTDAIAALNFTVRYDATKLRPLSRGPTVGTAVERARAELASVTDETASAVRVLVVPEFSPAFPVLRGGRIATLYFTVQSSVRGQRTGNIRRRLAIEDVVFGDHRGRELRPVLSPSAR